MNSAPGERIYEGSCHCGAIRFRFRSEEIVGGCRCNCSICSRRGAVTSERYYPPDAFELLSGRDALSVYLFGDKMVNHYFCKTCGVYPFHDTTDYGPGAKPGHYRVNLGCVDGVDTFSLKLRLLDGRSF